MVSKLDKIRAMAEDSRAHPNVREVAQRILDKITKPFELEYLRKWKQEIKDSSTWQDANKG